MMRALPLSRLGWLLGALMVLLVGACTSTATPSATATPSPWPTPPRYQAPTATVTPSPPPWPTGTVPWPTPTPLIYTIREGDTLSGIAARFGLPVQVLQKANPLLNPNAMPVGATLVVPLDPTYMPGLPTPTPPVGLALGPVDCYPTGEGGAWCFALVQNLTRRAWLHVAARLEVLTWGEEATPALRQANMTALAFHLPPGQILPLVAYFPPPWSERWQTRVALYRALPLNKKARARRFPPVTLEDPAYTWGPGGRWVRITTAWQTQEDATWVRLVAWGLDARGRVVAARAWTWEGPFPEETVQDVEVYLYTAGPPLHRVHLFVEGVRLEAEP